MLHSSIFFTAFRAFRTRWLLKDTSRKVKLWFLGCQSSFRKTCGGHFQGKTPDDLMICASVQQERCIVWFECPLWLESTSQKLRSTIAALRVRRWTGVMMWEWPTGLGVRRFNYGWLLSLVAMAKRSFLSHQHLFWVLSCLRKDDSFWGHFWFCFDHMRWYSTTLND